MKLLRARPSILKRSNADRLIDHLKENHRNMSQRNPMNERYTSEDRTGVTRKSAASAKPKAKAAA